MTFPGDHSEEVTPVPISNTEVKGLSGDGTLAFGHGRVARCREFIFEKAPHLTVRGLFLCSPAEAELDIIASIA